MGLLLHGPFRLSSGDSPAFAHSPNLINSLRAAKTQETRIFRVQVSITPQKKMFWEGIFLSARKLPGFQLWTAQ
jgi:hypothetical protein